ncbi:MAG: TrmH family RNA methyltransferase [Pseudomonadota bacterium]
MKNLKIVLVRPKYPRNVGMVSRIMCNYAMEDLFLIAPQCEMNEEAKQGAAQGQPPLENVKIYNTWEPFNQEQPQGLRLAFSRRQGKRRASLPLGETLELPVINLEKPTYLIFGAEDHGLNAEDLENVHRLAHFELPGELQSMNLSHSVLVASQMFFQKFGVISAEKNISKPGFADPEPFLKDWLEALNFDLESQTRWNALTMLRQLLMKATPTETELHQLEMIVRQTIRRLRQS